LADTALDYITSSLRLIGVKSQGQVASGPEAVDGLDTLNAIFDQWNSEGMMLFNITTAFCATTANDGIYTIGPTGDIVVTFRPFALTNAFYRTTSGGNVTDNQIQVITASDYASLIQKDSTGNVPYLGYYNPTMDNGVLTLFPVPSTAQQVGIQYNTPLNSAVTLSSTLTFPPAYKRAIRYALAIALAPEYGFAVTPDLAQAAYEAKTLVERNNTRVPTLEYALDIGDYTNDYLWR
jgi:hypothetical protein